MSKSIMEKVTMTFAILIFVCAVFICGYIETHYTRKDCTVVKVEGNCVTIEDGVGYEWCYEADIVPEVGVKVDIHMHTSFTDGNIFDDEIIGVKVQE